MNFNLEKKIIIISGGAKEISKGIIKALAAENAIPVIVGGNETDNLKMLETIDNKGFQIATELTNPVECENAVIKIVEKFGYIDGLINNAGVNDSVGLEKGNYEEFVALLHKNLAPCFLMTHFALPYLKKSKGAIINICFKTTEAGVGNIAMPPTSGGGREALTREWAVELLPWSIRVNAVVITGSSDALYSTSIEAFENPEKKLKSITENKIVTSGEIANVVVFLLSERSSHTTGEIVPVSSGDANLKD